MSGGEEKCTKERKKERKSMAYYRGPFIKDSPSPSPTLPPPCEQTPWHPKEK